MRVPSATHVSTVSPAPRKSRQGGTIPGKFEARLGERLIVEASRTPFCDGARTLLAEGLAAPGDLLIMRHAASPGCDAIKAAVGVAAALTVNETSGTGTPRFACWKPMPEIPSEGAAPMRENDWQVCRTARSRVPDGSDRADRSDRDGDDVTSLRHLLAVRRRPSPSSPNRAQRPAPRMPAGILAGG
jgi:hypothetical protein